MKNLRTTFWLVPNLLLAAGSMFCATTAVHAQRGAQFPEGEDPVIRAIQELNPQSPAELMNAVKIMVDYGRPNQVKVFATRLLKLEPPADVLVALHNEFGSSIFVRMAVAKDLPEEARILADAVLDAAHSASQDPARIQSLINRLGNPRPEVRRAAVNDLQSAGTTALGPLMQSLKDPSQEARHKGVRITILKLGNTAVEPLIGMLSAEDDALRARAIEMLGLLGSPRGMLYLVRPALDESGPAEIQLAAQRALLNIVATIPSPWEATRLLEERASEHFNGAPPLTPNADDLTELWDWDAETRRSVPRLYEARDAATVVAAQLAEDLFALAPTNETYRRLYLMTGLEATKTIEGLAQPLNRGAGTPAERMKTLGMAAIEDVLWHAIEDQRMAAAIGAAELLGDIGDATLLAAAGGRPSTLSRCLQHPNRRLRFAAAEAVVKIDPRRRFAGSSHLIATLAYMLQTTGERRALVGHPRSQLGQTLVGMLDERGFVADVQATGRQIFREAVTSPDIELLLVSDTVGNPPPHELIQMLRRDVRTANLPVGLISRGETADSNRRFADSDPRTIVVPFPGDSRSLSVVVRRLLSLHPRELIMTDERDTQAMAALEWLTRFVDAEDYDFHDVLCHQSAIISAMDVPGLATSAAPLVGLIGSSLAQRTLVTMASQPGRPLAHRQAAAAGFAQAVARRGIMLTSDEILIQYDKYNRSRIQDAETQQVLASILDAIELPAQALDEEPEEDV